MTVTSSSRPEPLPGRRRRPSCPSSRRSSTTTSGASAPIYAGPLKALINDQFLRLERLCELAEIPVHKWHGDVGQAARKRFFEKPSGVLLITPESIESLFINHSHKLATLFSGLSFFVIDEMHSFLGNERGAHLRSLMTRLTEKSRRTDPTDRPLRDLGRSSRRRNTGCGQPTLREYAFSRTKRAKALA